MVVSFCIPTRRVWDFQLFHIIANMFSLFKLFFLFNLTALGLSLWHMGSSLRHVGSFVVVCGLFVAACGLLSSCGAQAPESVGSAVVAPWHSSCVVWVL